MTIDPNLRSNNITATGLVRNGAGYVAGIIVNSHTSGTLKLWDNTSAALNGNITPQNQGLIMDTFTFPAGSGIYMLPFPIPFSYGCFATVGGTLNCQILISGNR